MSRDDWFESMYEANVSAVVAYCSRRLGRENAEDAAADVFVVAWRRFDEVPKEEILPWLYGVARKVVANHQRSRRRTSRLRARLRSVEGSAPEVVEVGAEISRDHEEIGEALRRLPERDQEILRLIAWEHLDRRTVADMFGVTPNAINKRVSRAYDRLGRLLGSRRRGQSQRLPASKRGEA